MRGFESRRTLWGIAALLALAAGAPAAAEEPARDATRNPVSLDSLLKLPSSTPAPSPAVEVGGASRREWEERFSRARGDLTAARAKLSDLQLELEQLASDSEAWQVAAPGGLAADTENGPLSFDLRQQIREAREEVEQAEQVLSELHIEANLAGVPQEWIGDEGPPTRTDPSLPRR